MAKGRTDKHPALTRAGLLVAAAVAVNVGLGWAVRELDLPLFLDSIGTVVVGATLGPVAGALTGAGSDLLTGAALGRTEAYPFAITGAFIGWAAAFAAGRGAFATWYRAALAGALTGVGAALVSAPIAAYVFGRPTGAGTDYATSLLRESGANLLQTTTLEGLLEDPVDKSITFVAAWAVLLALRGVFPAPDRARSVRTAFGGYTGSVLACILAAVVAVVFRPAFGSSGVLLFFLAVLAAALAGGRGPGLLAVAVGVCVEAMLITGAIGGVPGDVVEWIGLILFAVVATVMVIVIDDRERGRRELAASHRALAQTGKELQDTNADILAITNSVQEGLVVIEPSGTVVRANRHFYDLFPVTAQDIEGRTLESLREGLGRIFADGAALFEFVAELLPDATRHENKAAVQTWPVPREFVVTTSPVRARGEDYIGRLVVFRDVTRERRAEREKTEFFSAVSHELRTPLTSIKGYSEMILDGDAGDINPEALDFVTVIHSNSDRLVGLVNDLLDYQRLTSGRVRLRQEPVDLSRVLQEVSDSMAHLISSKSQDYRIDFDPAARWALGDEDKTLQVLTNYISNAYKYSPEGATITVGIRAAEDMAVVSVADTGMGIAEEDQKQLFTRFYRVDNSATREVGGTGLGLSIVKEIVEAQGGEVGVSSAPGDGATFTFTIPLLDNAAEGFGNS